MPKRVEVADRQRRSGAEVRRLILEAARAEFAENGYSKTTYRDIAARSGVVLSVLYRNFETKSELFSEAVVEPFVRGVEKLANEWMAQAGDPMNDKELMKVFIRDVLESFAEHQHALEQLVLGRAELSEAMTRRINSVFGQLFAQTRLMAELEARTRGWFAADGLDLSIRVLTCMIAGASAFGWFLLPEESRKPDSDAVLDAMAELGLWGLARQPAR